MSYVSWGKLIQVGILAANILMVLLNCVMVFVNIHNKRKKPPHEGAVFPVSITVLSEQQSYYYSTTAGTMSRTTFKAILSEEDQAVASPPT